jgi:hypothetical protein
MKLPKPIPTLRFSENESVSWPVTFKGSVERRPNKINPMNVSFDARFPKSVRVIFNRPLEIGREDI